MDPQTIRIKLRAQVQLYPPSSFLTRHEVYYPEAVIRVDGDRFQISQRKSYINPWEPVFNGTVGAGADHGTDLRGRFTYTSFLSRGIGLYKTSIFWTLSGVAALLFTAYVVPDAIMRSIFFITLICALEAGYLTSLHRCERRYKNLATGEEDFIRDFLSRTLNVQQTDGDNVDHEGPEYIERNIAVGE